MSDQPFLNEFGGSDKLLAYLKEKSEQIEKAVIPQFPFITIVYDGEDIADHETGMVIQMIDGSRTILRPRDAEMILNDGILNRMRIRIQLWRE